MNKIVCNTSVTDLIECTKIALVLSNQTLQKNSISSYVPSSFPKFAYVNQSNDLDNLYYKEFEYVLTPEHLIDFKFNYILMLGKDGKCIAFVRLEDGTINTTRLKTETVTVIFELEINTIINTAILDAKVNTDFKVHNKLLISNGAVNKRSVENIKLSTYKPFTSSIVSLKNNSDYIMKYSGSIVKDKKFVNPIVIEYKRDGEYPEDYNVSRTESTINGMTDHKVVGIVTIDGEPKVITKIADVIYCSGIEEPYNIHTTQSEVQKNNEVIRFVHEHSFEAISNDYLILDTETTNLNTSEVTNHYSILRISDTFNNNPPDPIYLSPGINYVIDSVTGDTYFYKPGLGENTYYYTVNAGEVYCSSKMQNILENLTNNVMNNYSSPIVMLIKNRELLAITDGLAVYKDNSTGKLVFHSSLNIVSDVEDQTTAKYAELDPIELIENKFYIGTNSYNKDQITYDVFIYSNRSIIIKYNAFDNQNNLVDYKYVVWELVKNYMDNYNWIQSELGRKGFMHSIYKIAKQKYSNTNTEFIDIIYKGNLFEYYSETDYYTYEESGVVKDGVTTKYFIRSL